MATLRAVPVPVEPQGGTTRLQVTYSLEARSAPGTDKWKTLEAWSEEVSLKRRKEFLSKSALSYENCAESSVSLPVYISLLHNQRL